MKVRVSLILGLLSACVHGAQVPLSGPGTGPNISIAELEDRGLHQQIPVENLLRRVDGKVEDLRPWVPWRNGMIAAVDAHKRGIGTPAARQAAMLAPNPLPRWRPVHGRVAFVKPDGDVAVQLSLGRQVKYAMLRNWPGRLTAVTGTDVKVLAKLIGSSPANTVGGASLTLPLYDYGTPLPPDEISAIMQAEAATAATAKAAQDTAAAELAAKRKAEAAERVEKARAAREAKEKQEPAK
jgi:hypothetical protein